MNYYISVYGRRDNGSRKARYRIHTYPDRWVTAKIGQRMDRFFNLFIDGVY